MKETTKKYLIDIINSAIEIDDYTKALSFDDYLKSKITQRAVERSFEIIGEALNKVKFQDQEVVCQISEHQRIIGFRNVLIHGYSEVDERVVWDAVTKHLPKLIAEVKNLI